MRYLLILGLVLATSSVNQPLPGMVIVTIAPAATPNGYASVGVTQTGMYLGGPFAGVNAKGTNDVSFGIRAWHEHDKSRVVVYALFDDNRAPGGKTETPISTFTIVPGQTVDVPEAAKWGGAPVSVTAKVSDGKDILE